MLRAHTEVGRMANGPQRWCRVEQRGGERRERQCRAVNRDCLVFHGEESESDILAHKDKSALRIRGLLQREDRAATRRATRLLECFAFGRPMKRPDCFSNSRQDPDKKIKA
jgi:hypothetical protein